MTDNDLKTRESIINAAIRTSGLTNIRQAKQEVKQTLTRLRTRAKRHGSTMTNPVKRVSGLALAELWERFHIRERIEEGDPTTAVYFIDWNE